jgi:hypothetical protein
MTWDLELAVSSAVEVHGKQHRQTNIDRADKKSGGGGKSRLHESIVSTWVSEAGNRPSSTREGLNNSKTPREYFPEERLWLPDNNPSVLAVRLS